MVNGAWDLVNGQPPPPAIAGTSPKYDKGNLELSFKLYRRTLRGGRTGGGRI